MYRTIIITLKLKKKKKLIPMLITNVLEKKEKVKFKPRDLILNFKHPKLERKLAYY